jgi:hypothetical protein
MLHVQVAQPVAELGKEMEIRCHAQILDILCRLPAI